MLAERIGADQSLELRFSSGSAFSECCRRQAASRLGG
jgi:hypothetical protein